MTVQTDDGFVYPTWSFGDRVRKARDTTGLNQKDFASAIGASEGSIATWETGRAKPRDIVAVAKRIEFLTRIPASWTLGIADGMTPRGGGDGGGLEPPGGIEPPTYSLRVTGTAANADLSSQVLPFPRRRNLYRPANPAAKSA
jgi:transcriptional regulator with XRE-family HTH domain